MGVAERGEGVVDGDGERGWKRPAGAKDRAEYGGAETSMVVGSKRLMSEL
jgi:hypothetical protein